MNAYYLYVFSIDILGKYELIKGKLFFDKYSAIDEGKKLCNTPRIHAQVVSCNDNCIIYEQ